MANRLVLGSGSLVQPLVESLDCQPELLTVGTDDEHLAAILRETGITVEQLNPTDTETLRELDGVEVVFVLEDEQWDNLVTARAVRNAHPDAYILAYSGEDASDHGASLAGTVDRVVDPGNAVAASLLERVGDASRRIRQLWQVLGDIDRLAVLTHDNPDPDAIASGVALQRLATAAGCEADVCYYGNITHQENRAFVNVLDLELRNLDDDEQLTEYDGIALVDHSRPGVNDQLPEDAVVDIVIDHHPPRAPVDARFVDLRSHVGATSTLLVEYLGEFGLIDEETVATALLFGIHVDTKAFTREVSREDFEAAAILVAAADLGTLERIEAPSISPQTFDTVARAIQNRTVEGEVLHSFVGKLSDRDALAQAADKLLTIDDVTTTLVYGLKDGTIYVSARARGSDIDIGETLREAFDPIGSAGGHVDMAGAQIPLGVLEAVGDDDESLQQIIEDVITNQFLEAITTATSPPVSGVYASDIDPIQEYLAGTPETSEDEYFEREKTARDQPEEDDTEANSPDENPPAEK